jgi:hypothetical protein
LLPDEGNNIGYASLFPLHWQFMNSTATIQGKKLSKMSRRPKYAVDKMYEP